METLPLVWQMVLTPASWQVGRALAAGAETPATTAKPANTSADLPRTVILSSVLSLSCLAVADQGQAEMTMPAVDVSGVPLAAARAIAS